MLANPAPYLQNVGVIGEATSIILELLERTPIRDVFVKSLHQLTLSPVADDCPLNRLDLVVITSTVLELPPAQTGDCPSGSGSNSKTNKVITTWSTIIVVTEKANHHWDCFLLPMELTILHSAVISDRLRRV